MSDTSLPIANPAVVLREEFDDWAVLFNPDTGSAVGVNPVGVAVWKSLDGKRSIDDIVSDVAKRFEGVPEAAAEEIASFVDALAEQGYISCEPRE